MWFGVFIVSSFGEKITYWGFLINRLSELVIKTLYGQAFDMLVNAIILGLADYSLGPMGKFQTAVNGLALSKCNLKLKKRI